MRLTYVLLVVAAALVPTTDATGATLAKPIMANAVADTYENIQNDRRFLRQHKVVNDDDDGGKTESEEERGWMDSIKANAVLLKLSMARTTDDMGPILAEVRDAGVFAALFEKGVSHLKKLLPSFETGMDVNKFDELLQASNLSDDIKTVLFSAYTKYWFTNHQT
ncbi:hypothetical protein ON010_g19099 [Phytophthora cinnamomi]|nr:hypothetical protein ON010_g19099 [Phytophthora cinnamomi]